VPHWERGSPAPRAPASHRFRVLRNLLPAWKRCLRLLETECFLLWGWFLQGSEEQRAEDAAAGDEELHREPAAWHANPVGRLCRGLHCLSCLPAMLIHKTDLRLVLPQPGWMPNPSLPTAPYRALTMANTVLVDGLHLAQQMVQSFSLPSSPWSPAVVLPPVCGGPTSITPSTWPIAPSIYPSTWEKGLPDPSSPWHVTSWHPTYVSHKHRMAQHGTAAVMGAGQLWVGWALGDPPFCPCLPRSISALHSTPWPLATPQHSGDTAEGKNKVLSVAATLHRPSKIKFFPVSSSRSSPELQLSPGKC